MAANQQQQPNQEWDKRNKYRYWLLTIKESSWVPNLPNGVDYCKGQLEEGGQQGYRHWQLIAYFKTPVRFTTVKKAFTSDTHCEPSYSSAVEGYVWKDETRIGEQFEFGAKAGKRNAKDAWVEVRDILKETGDVRKVIEEYPDIGMRYVTPLQKVAQLFATPPVNLSAPCGIWIHGPPGVGKSRWVREMYGDSLFSKDATPWWCNYNKEHTVLMDDLDDAALKNKDWPTSMHDIKIWADEYVFEGRIKGIGTVKLRPQRFVVTSNYSIEELFHHSTLCEAVTRRFYVIYIPTKRW